MNLNDLYRGNSDITFKVTGVELKDNDPWVSYINLQTQQAYSCRQAAFLARYSLLPQPR